MKTANRSMGPARPGRAGGRGRVALVLAALTWSGGIASATNGEEYPDWTDAGVEQFVRNWEAKFKPEVATLCTGTVTRSGEAHTRDPVKSTPNVPGWTPLGGPREGGGRQLELHGGGDTDDVGVDSFLYVKVVGTKANLCATAILEAEDGANVEWRLRYEGTDTATYTNGPTTRADVLRASNPWSIGWTRRVADFDAKAGEFDEQKQLQQDFTVTVRLINGATVTAGRTFERSVPATETIATNVGLNGEVGVKASQETEATAKLGIGVGRQTTRSYDRKFQELVESGAVEGEALWAGLAPCPFSHTWSVSTTFDCDLAVRDFESENGSKGARQELRVTVLNAITPIVADKCHACGTPPLTPVDPVPPAVTPQDPAPIPAPDPAPNPVTTPEASSTPVLPGGQVVPTDSSEPSDPEGPGGTSPVPNGTPAPSNGTPAPSNGTPAPAQQP